MKPGDLVIIVNSNENFDRVIGLNPETLDADSPWLPNGTLGVYCDEPDVECRKFRVLVNGKVQLIDPSDVRPTDEAR